MHVGHGEPIGWAAQVVLHFQEYLGEAGQTSGQEALTVHRLSHHPLFGERIRERNH